MDGQPFDRLVGGEEPLLAAVEEVIVDAHRRWRLRMGQADWRPPAAYRWLHFEDPDPVGRLLDGARRLAGEVELSDASVGDLTELARRLGYGGPSAREGTDAGGPGGPAQE